ncbi:MAG: carboxypeptidase-like regulatory domain-containing protein [bacterium]|nr:carboxypeptidase-like regulatory domain-containing protein [bacterium]
MALWGQHARVRWAIVGLLAFSGVSAALSLNPDVQRGLVWLEAKVTATGAMAGEDASIATPLQNRDEALRTLQLLSSGNAALVGVIGTEDTSSTEYLARQALSLGGAGTDVSVQLSALVARQNSDGGIGSKSSALDSAWALAALSQQPAQYSNAIAGLETYLFGQQWQDGGLAGLSDASRIEASSLMLLAQQALPASLDVRNSMNKLSAWLSQLQRADGSWGGDLYLTAYALAALTPVSADSAQQQSAASFLKGQQGVNGDWNNDPFITAVILRALSQTSVDGTGSTTSVTGQILSSSGNLPLSGVSIAVDGTATAIMTDAQGKFVLTGLASSNHNFSFLLAGYQPRIISATVPALGSLDLGVMLLSPMAGSNILSGYIYDVDSQQPLAGATVTVASVPAITVQTDAAGHYQISNIAAGTFSLMATAGGYTVQNYAVTVASGSNLLHFKLRKQSNPTPLPTGPATLSGQVVTLGSGQAISDVQILVNQQVIASSNASGNFSLSFSAGTYQIDYQKAGFLTLTQQVSVTEGSVVSIGQVALTPQRTTTRLSGIVRDAQTQQVLPDAAVQIIDGVMSRADQNGHYVLDNLSGTQFDVRVSATGYNSETTRLGVSFPGEVTYDFALAAQASQGVQIAPLGVAPATAGLHADVLATTSYQNTGTEDAMLVSTLQLLDANGQVVSAAVAYANATDSIPLGTFTLAVNESKPVFFRWNSGQFPPGRYQLVARASAAGTISRSNILGTVLAERSGSLTLTAKEHFAGSITATPPVQQAGNVQPVHLTAVVQNDGNVASSSRQFSARLDDEKTGAPVTTLTATVSALPVGQLASVNFGSWSPAAPGSYHVTLLNEANETIGSPSRVYIGDAAKGFFTVNKVVVPTGNQIVKGYVALSGVDPVTGEITDPMAPLIKAAIQKAVSYNDTNASAWVSYNGCAGCHIASQAIVGGETNNGLANYDAQKRSQVIGKVVSTLHPEDGYFDDNDPYFKSQSTLSFWGLMNVQNNASLAGTYASAAKYLLSFQEQSGEWGSDDPNTGQWWANSLAATALNVDSLVRYTDFINKNQPASFYWTFPFTQYGQSFTCPCSLTLDADKNLYVTHVNEGILERVSPDGTRQTLLSGYPDMRNVLVRANGDIYVGMANGLVKRSANGSVKVIGNVRVIDVVEAPNGNIFAASYNSGTIYTVVNDQLVYYVNAPNNHHIAVGHDGNLYYTTWGDGIIVKVSQNKALSVAGRYPRGAYPYQLLQYPDGRWAVSGMAGIYLMSEDFSYTIQRVTAQESYGMAMVDGVLVYAPSEPGSLMQYSQGGMPAMFGMPASIAPSLAKAKTWLLQNSEPTSLGTQRKTMALIGLASLENYFAGAADPAIKTRMQELDAALRSLQNTDGGWGIYPGWGSDPLVTAQVGYALDKLNPSPDDPAVQKAIQWILSQQAADGSWHSAQMMTNVAATTWVAIWLPIALNRVGGIDTDLHLSFPSGIHLANPSVAPADSFANTDGSTNYHWNFLGVTANGRNINFDLTLDNLLPNEQRPVAAEAHLAFNNSFTNSRVTAPLAIPVVSASNGLNLSLNTDQNSYGANTPVVIAAGVGNTGAVLQDGSVHLWVYAQDGTQVADLGIQSFTGLASSTQQALSGAWNTATLLPNAYYVQATLYDSNGQQVGTARKDLVIVSSSATGHLLSGQVTTDKGSYGALDRVHVTDRIANLTTNTLVGNLQLQTTITSPANLVVWSHQDSVSQLVAGGLKDFAFDVPVANAPAGVYTVSLQVTDSSGAVQAQSSTNYAVFSSAANGAGLGGTLALARRTLVPGETQTISMTLNNQGNALINALPVTVSIVDPVNNLVVAQWQDTVPSLAVAGTANLSHTWVTQGDYGRNLVAVLTTGITGTRALAQSVFSLAKPSLTLTYASNKPLYDVNESALLTAAVVSGVNLPLTDLSVVQQIKRPDGTVLWQSTQTGQLLAALGSLTRQDPVALGRSAAGNYTGTLSVLDKQGVLLTQTTTVFEIRSTALTGAGLTGSVSAVPAELPQGETAVLGINIGNQGNADLVNLPLQVVVKNVATGQVVKQFDMTVASLLQSTVFTQAFNWVPTDAAGTVYDVKLQATVNGAALLLAETGFKVAALPIKFGVDSHWGGQSRVLVYLNCHPDWQLSCSGWKYGDHKDPCFVTRSTTLSKYLNQLGVPYQIVTEQEDFRRELRSGRYNNYWLLGAVEAVPHNLLEEVREAVFRGDTLVVDGGLQRWDNHDFYPMLGVQYRGYLTFSDQKATFKAPVYGAAMSPFGPQQTAGKPLFLQSYGSGRVTATYDGNKCTKVDFADMLFGFSWKKPATYPAAITNTFGKGKTLTFAFDVIDSLPALTAAPAWTEMLRESIAFTQPLDMMTTSLVPGDYQRYSLTVTNQAKAASLVATMTLPAGSVLVNTQPASVTNANGSLSFTFTLPESGVQVLDAGFRVPVTAGNYPVTTTLRVAGSTADYGSYTSTLGVLDTVNRASQARTSISSLPIPFLSLDRTRQTHALMQYDLAMLHYNLGKYWVAIDELAEVGEELGTFTQTDTSNARVNMDLLLRDWEGQWWRACATTNGPSGSLLGRCGP